MRSDVRRQCRSCLPCVTRTGCGSKVRPTLKPIPVGGPFHRVGVDVLSLPQTSRYAVVFVDYLTKWPKVFAVPDHRAETIARVLVEHVICRHGVPNELLSDRGADFLLELISKVCKLTNMKKVNTSAYHPQSDGMVERLNRTLTDMMAKHASFHGSNWDRYLPYLLFAYRVRPHSSTGESPFYLLYGRDARLPTEAALEGPTSLSELEGEDYRTDLLVGFSTARANALHNVEEAQRKYKDQYDRQARPRQFRVGDRVFVDRQMNKKGKLSRPFEGPYRVISATENTVQVRPVGKPDDHAEWLNMERVRFCPGEIPDIPCVGKSTRRRH